jgi:hypothetical protein
MTPETLEGAQLETPTNDLVNDLSARLPAVSEIALRPWPQSFGGDYYGALQVAADYCGLRKVPQRFPGSWQHGMIPPWHRIRPEVVVYDAPRSAKCFVARQDEATFLKEGGYDHVHAIGLPIIYTRPSGLKRIPDSILVMPTHSLASDVLMPSCEQYVSEIASIKDKFRIVAACVSAYCIAKNLWVPQFAEHGIPVVRGAGISDVNALNRMRALFDSFEYMTTDSFGSHVFYALHFGVKVSIWGTATPVFRENVLKDGGWTAYPEAVDQLFSEETIRKGEVYLGPLRIAPWTAKQNVQVGQFMLGHENKLTPDQMRVAFGWTPLNNLVGSAAAVVRRLPFRRAVTPAKQYLLSLARNSVCRPRSRAVSGTISQSAD